MHAWMDACVRVWVFSEYTYKLMSVCVCMCGRLVSTHICPYVCGVYECVVLGCVGDKKVCLQVCMPVEVLLAAF